VTAENTALLARARALEESLLLTQSKLEMQRKAWEGLAAEQQAAREAALAGPPPSASSFGRRPQSASRPLGEAKIPPHTGPERIPRICALASMVVT
jgi:hypothetical protein